MSPNRFLSSRSLSLFVIVVLSLLSAGCADTSSPAPSSPVPSSPTTSSQPPAAAVPASNSTSSGDWVMYGHDAQRTSYDPDETSISASNIVQLDEAWQQSIGIGDSDTPAFSAPSIAGGLLFVASSVSKGNNFFALDADDGAERWSANIGLDPKECFGVGIGSTPSISDDDHTVVIGGGDSAYYGLNTLDGALLWRDPLNEGPSAFAWTSPLIVNGKAYVGIASDCDDPSVRGNVYSVDLSAGSQVANHYMVPEDRGGAGIWNSAAISVDGSKLFVTTGEDFKGYDGPDTRAIMELDANSLQTLASNRQGVPNTDGDWATTPVVFQDSAGRPMVGAGHKDGIFYAYYQDSINAGPAWSSPTGPSVGMLPAFDPTAGNGGAIFVSKDRKVYALNASDGTMLWASDYLDKISGNLAIANGVVYANANGSLVALDEVSGVTLRTISPENHGPGMSGPAVAHGMVYWVSGAFINAWHLPYTAS